MNTIPLEPPEPGETSRPSESETPGATAAGPNAPGAVPSGSAPESAPAAAPAPPAGGVPTGTFAPAETSLAPERQRSNARTGTIVWGVLVLIFCAIVLQRTFAPGTFDPVIWVTGVVLGLGALLLVVAVAVILRSRR